jgi:uncharacterized membrane protein
MTNLTNSSSLQSPSDGDHRIMAAACLGALASLVPIALYQTKVNSHLPDPPLALFDSDQITRSKAAHPFGMPDALLGFASFSLTLILINASRYDPRVRKLLGAKLALDAGAASMNVTRQVFSFGKLCSWCMGTAISTGVMAFAGRRLVAELFADARPLLKNEV